MKFISADKDSVVIEFTNEDYHRLFQISQAVYQQYERIGDTVLELSLEEVREFSDDVVAVMDARHGITNDEK